jgi:hypothetical protein
MARKGSGGGNGPFPPPAQQLEITLRNVQYREQCSHLVVRELGKRREIPCATGANHRLQCLMASQHVVLMDNSIPRLHMAWMTRITDLVSGIPLELPPLPEVNREINLVDPMKHIRCQLPKCPEHFRKDLSAKIERYTIAEWWVPSVAHQTVPMLCVPKKNGMFCTIFDLGEQNKSTVKDVTPFPD